MHGERGGGKKQRRVKVDPPAVGGSSGAREGEERSARHGRQ